MAYSVAYSVAHSSLSVFTSTCAFVACACPCPTLSSASQSLRPSLVCPLAVHNVLDTTVSDILAAPHSINSRWYVPFRTPLGSDDLILLIISLLSFFSLSPRLSSPAQTSAPTYSSFFIPPMSNKGRSTPRVVCCAIPISRAAGKVLLVTSRKRKDYWVCESHPISILYLSSTHTCHHHHHPHLPSISNPSTKRWMGAVRWGARSSSLTGSLGRRSYPLSLIRPSPLPNLLSPPHLSPLWPSLLPFIHPLSPPPPQYPSIPPPLAGVRGTITRFVTTIPSASSTYHFYELDVLNLDADWLESNERRREWVDYSEAIRRIAWKSELAQGLAMSSLAPQRR